MNAGPSGFNNAPITKGIVVVCGLASLLVGTTRTSVKICSLSYQAVVRKLQLWRIVTSNCVFASSTPELVFGLYLIYFFRVFERQIGSNKYAVFVLISSGLSTALQLVVLTVLRDPTSSGLSMSPGPYGLIFASFVPFFFDIPVSTRFRVFGVQFSDKSIVYLAGLQLLLSSWKQSLIPGLCGILAGFAYRSNIFGIKRIKFPQRLASIASSVFSPLLSSRQPSRPNATTTQSPPPPPHPRIPAPPEESVAMLVSMGFERVLAVEALTQARNDLTLATNILLEQQQHH